MRVLVTGAGGAAGACIIKDLVKRHEVFVTDTNDKAAALYFVDKKHMFVAPKVGSKKFIQDMLRLAKKEKIEVLIPTVEEELVHFAKHKKLFEENGIRVIVSNVDSLLRTSDKSKTYEFFKGESFSPKIYSKNSAEFPAVVKPANSRGGRGVHKCVDNDELRVFLRRSEREFGKSVIMEYINGKEFSVYGLSNLNANPIVVVPLRRIRAASESKEAQVRKDKQIIAIATEIAKKAQLEGPWNIQLMKNGRNAKLIEINSRFAGTTSLVIEAGVNLPELAIKLFTNQPIAKKELEYVDGIYMTRYNEEVFIYPENMLQTISERKAVA